LKTIANQPKKLINKPINGDRIKIHLLERRGNIISLNISLIASAKGCNIPQNPTTLGPILR
jgi:hypothetical protein